MHTLCYRNAVLLGANGIVLVSESVPKLLIDGIQFDRNLRIHQELARSSPLLALSEDGFDTFEKRLNRRHHA